MAGAKARRPTGSAFSTEWLPGAGNDAPARSAVTFFSIDEVTASASSSRPWLISQRGLSGIARRRNQTNSAPVEPIKTTHRQPSNPNGLIGTSL